LIETRGVSGFQGLFAVTQIIYVAVCDEIVHSRSSNKTDDEPTPAKLLPVKVTVVPPTTEPNLGLMLVSNGVEALL
jgi:hypothetical protein